MTLLLLIYYGDFSFYINSRGDIALINVKNGPKGFRLVFPSRDFIRTLKNLVIEVVEGLGIKIKEHNTKILITHRKDICSHEEYKAIIYVNARKDICRVLPTNDKLEVGEAYDLKNLIKVNKIHDMHVRSEFFDYLIKGVKKVEGRLYDGKRRKIRSGDYIRLRDELNREAFFLVKDILIFKSFQEMFNTLNFSLFIPNAKSIEDAIRVYRTFYSEEEEKRYGVCAIFLDPL